MALCAVGNLDVLEPGSLELFAQLFGGPHIPMGLEVESVPLIAKELGTGQGALL
jgi:hypothetical protein